MGPRSFERGDPLPHQPYRIFCRGFNGAALFRARRQLDSLDKESEIERFNGAALFRARRPHFVRHPDASADGFNGAALFRARRPVSRQLFINESHASMGPRSFERGDNPVIVAATASAAVLQWGRALSSAET